MLVLWVCALTVQAELKFPSLTGRVVDNAQMIEPSVREQLTQQLKAHESATGEQLVVVTLPDLQGTDIADFGYQLGRAWGIGQKDKNNGALLIVARDERKLRIEVGYGLEDRLTDAQSSVIINQVITPRSRLATSAKASATGSRRCWWCWAAVRWMNRRPSMNHAVMRTATSWRAIGVFVFLVMLFILTVFVCQMLGILPAGRRGSGGSGGGFGGGGFGGRRWRRGLQRRRGSFGGGGSSGGW